MTNTLDSYTRYLIMALKSFIVQTPNVNAQVCLVSLSVTKKKSLMTWTPGVNVIKLFSIVTDDEAL